MHIESIKRWQWIVLGLILGLAVGFSRRLAVIDLPGYGEGITDQRLFERRVLSKAGSTPLFKDIRVSLQVLEDGSGNAATFYIVSGMSVPDSAKAGDRYKPMWFAAPIPYQPTVNIAQLEDPKSPRAAARWQAIAQPTVLDFLKFAHDSIGVSFTHAWWDTYPLATFTLAGVLLIGILWPFVVNLYYFRSLFRRAEEKGVSLRGMNLPPSTSNAAKTEMSEADLAHLHELEQELESSLASGAAATEPKKPMAAPIRTLTTGLAGSAVEQPEDDRHFKAKPEDYYPTEDRAHPPR